MSIDMVAGELEEYIMHFNGVLLRFYFACALVMTE
jgi:hypothetical protein